MITEPVVHVGILSGKEIHFCLHRTYRTQGVKTTGDHVVRMKEGKLFWMGDHYESITFEPEENSCYFDLKKVTIGLDFHWERKEDQSFEGGLKFIIEEGRVRIINIVSAERYLSSVISSEMSASASLALLQAHAVISRSWLLAQLLKDKKKTAPSFVENENERIKWYDRDDHENFDVCADDHCQRYQGITRKTSPRAEQAVQSTYGEILSYKGEICDTRFSKCCGGVLEEFETCWENIHHPYLVGLRDGQNVSDFPDLRVEANAVAWIKSSPEAFCNTSDKNILSQVLNDYDQETSDFYRWKVSYKTSDLSDLLKKRSGIDFGEIKELLPLERGVSGRIIRLKIVGDKKTMIIGKELEIRKILSDSHLYSSAFYVEKTDEGFILHGAGWGHGVGLCQIGAAVMGEKGYSYEQILLHYYKGAKLKKIYEES